ncbi:uncharacterized protein Dvir_GJ11310 [Drosophila virilis]|uniref:cathepsin L n=1 Tax=Drosophila virilis TaxID=7244 RepID=B4LC37_DROVI|nr:uncharacterized protein Dvir_GJ11310 [Drosophila virilis]
MNAVCVVLVLIGSVQSIASDAVLEAEWKSFKEMHGRSYAGDSEELLRRRIFEDNKKLIDTHNARYEAGKETYKMGVNEFTDLLPSEFVSRMMGSLNRTAVTADYIYEPSANLQIPESIDWRTKGAVSPVKNQGTCGSCWTFAAVGTLEGQSFLRTKRMVELSEQNLLDCSSHPPYRNHGCQRGYPYDALRYVKDNQGLDTRSSYPYQGVQGRCRFRKEHVGVRIKGVATVRSGDERALQAAVAEKGPIAVGIDVQHLQHYHSGIYNRPCFGPAFLHAVVLVGYGRDRGHDYWLLKNSWGNWGEAGYFRMARNSQYGMRDDKKLKVLVTFKCQGYINACADPQACILIVRVGLTANPSMNAVCVVLVLIGSVQSIASDAVLEAEWKSFKEMHGRSYAGDSEELLRRRIFEDNKKLIDTHNARYEAGKETYKMGVNEFTDLLPSEFVSRMMGSLNRTAVTADYIYEPSANLQIPESIDWRTKGAVSPVKNQGTCGSCWTFAAVGTLEGQSFLRTKRMVELSEQNLLDCSSHPPYRNHGCQRGYPYDALRYVKDNQGLDTRSSYPYQGVQGRCRFRREHVGVRIKGVATVRSGDERALQAAVAEKGPIAGPSMRSICSTTIQESTTSLALVPHTSMPLCWWATAGTEATITGCLRTPGATGAKLAIFAWPATAVIFAISPAGQLIHCSNQYI